MFVDTSAFVAILLREPDGLAFSAAIDAARERTTSGVVRLKTVMVASTRLDVPPEKVEAAFDRILSQGHFEVTPIADDIARVAVSAFSRFGKGRGHPAQRNFADCLSYACAKAGLERLLFKGDDFGHTDVNSGLRP